MLRSLPFGRAVIVMLALGFAVLLGIGGVTAWLGGRASRDAEAVARSNAIAGAAIQLYVALREIESGQRGYLVTDDPKYLQVYQLTERQGRPNLARLERLVRNDPVQAAEVERMRPLVERKLAEMERTVRLAQAGRKATAVEIIKTDEGRNLTYQIGGITTRLVNREIAALQASQRSTIRLSNLLLTFNLVGVVLVAGMAIVSVAVASGAFNAVRSASRELKRSNEGLERTVEERTRDIREANEEIQRFAYIVSHDLRSPLVNVMGFTSEMEAGGAAIRRQLGVVRDKAPDLLDPEAVLAAEEDLPESIGFIRASTAKMDRLINAILRLSRDGRRVLAPAPIDMTAMCRQIADSLQVMADAAVAEIVVEPLPELVSDRLAMEQVFSNVVENAVKYLQPDRPGRIVITGRRRGPLCIYEVTDNGRGIAEADLKRVFELFRRAGTQDKPGEGLGLAFVQANVRRLGGTIELSSVYGQGSTFTFTFPAQLVLEDAAAQKDAA